MVVDELAGVVAACLAKPPAAGWRDRLTHCLLDWTGVAVAGAGELVAARVADHVRRHRPGSGALIVGGRASLSGVVLANAAAGHALDYDDTHLGYWGHPGATVIPTALALARDRSCNGAALLDAIGAGMEICHRLGLMMGESHRAAGWHVTATSGLFGGAAVAAALTGLDSGRLGHAFALCAVQAGGLAAAFGSDAKAFQVGRAAELGLEACQLADAGLDAPSDIIERPGGMADAYAFGTRDLPHPPEPVTEGILFKLAPACFGVQAPVVAAHRLARGLGTAPAPAAIEVEIPPAFVPICTVDRPATVTEARFSLSFMVALTLSGHDPSGADAIGERLLHDPAIAALADKVRVTPNAALSASEARVTLRFPDARVPMALAVDMAARGPEALGEERDRSIAKFRRNCDPHLGAARAEALCETLLDIGRLGDCSPLPAMMARI